MYKLLIVDDEKMIRMGIKNGVSWKESGIEEVYVAASAREALEIIERHHPEVMITDICMTEMNGLDLIATLRKNRENDRMRIIVLTGYDRFDYVRECLRMKVHNFLLKPIDEEELQRSVEEQIQILKTQGEEETKEKNRIRAKAAGWQMYLEQFMRDLICHRGENRMDWPQELEQKRYRAAVAAIVIPEIGSTGAAEPEERFKEQEIRKGCLDLIDARGMGITFQDEEDRVVIVLQADQNRQSVLECIQELADFLESEYGVRIRIVLGSRTEGLDQVWHSYQDALSLLGEKEKEIENIIRVREDKKRDTIIQDVQREFKKAMCDNLADAERVMQIYDKFCRAMSSYKLSDRQVQNWCFEAAAAVCYKSVSVSGEKTACRLDELMNALQGLGREAACELTGTFIRKLLLGKEDSRHDIVEKAKQYILTHLEEELSIVSLAEMFYLSPSYFSRLFKKVNGEGCNEYIVRKRIDKSKYLLKETDIPIGEVAKISGYKNINYFSYAFKKYTGMSPAKYREKK